MLKILLIGATGLIGSEMKRVLKERSGIVLLTPSSKKLNIISQTEVKQYFKKRNPNIVINCAGYTDVDGAEENNYQAYLLNQTAVFNLANACNKHRCKLVHLSTDFVFSGDSNNYKERSAPSPINRYGDSKLQGERAIFNQMSLEEFMIVRTSSPYSTRGKNFYTKILELSRTKSSIHVFKDIIMSPTNITNLCKQICELINNDVWIPIIHITDLGECSWYEFAKEICRDLFTIIKPSYYSERSRIANRPLNSSLSNELLIDLTKTKNIKLYMENWEISLNKMKEGN